MWKEKIEGYIAGKIQTLMKNTLREMGSYERPIISHENGWHSLSLNPREEENEEEEMFKVCHNEQ